MTDFTFAGAKISRKNFAAFIGAPAAAFTLGAGILVATTSVGLVLPIVAGVITAAAGAVGIAKNINILRGVETAANDAPKTLTETGIGYGLRTARNLAVAYTGLMCMAPGIIFGLSAAPLVAPFFVAGAIMAVASGFDISKSTYKATRNILNIFQRRKDNAKEAQDFAAPAHGPAVCGFAADSAKSGFDKAIAPVADNDNTSKPAPKPAHAPRYR